MFQAFKINSSKDAAKEKVEFYAENEIALISENNNDDLLKSLRKLLEKEFKKNNFPQDLYMDKVKSKELYELIYSKILNTKELKEFFSELEKKYQCGPISIFPCKFMRNYFPNTYGNNSTFHSDAQGQHKFEYCERSLANKKNIMGKLVINLQKNSKFGGGIDVLPFSYKKNMDGTWQPAISKFNFNFKRLKVLWIIYQLLSKFNLGNIEIPFTNTILLNFFSRIAGAKSVKLEPLSTLVFGQRIFHRGTLVDPLTFKELMKENDEISFKKGIPANIDIGENNKCMIYFWYGSQEGLNSYMYLLNNDKREKRGGDRIKKDWTFEFKNNPIYRDYFKESENMFNVAINQFHKK